MANTATSIQFVDFPSAEVTTRLTHEIEQIVEDQSILRPTWSPLLDSLRIVGILAVLKDIVPFKIPPEKVVRKGGYRTMEEAVEDIHDNLQEIWKSRGKMKGSK